MGFLFQSTESFELDLETLQEEQRTAVVEAINTHCPNFQCDQDAFFRHAYQPQEIALLGECCSSLYVLPVNDDQSIILTVDEDPLFDQIIVTLIRIVQSARIMETYLDVARLIYNQSGLAENIDG
ncbi:MAG: hypothetical protein JW920_07835 [Deltaproteobacteria bacterium]|nr:hypothetical protein [Deltaproteobacteria bacterium]